MGLIRVGSLWEKDFKNGQGFSGQLDAEELEKILADNPDEAKITVLVFDNAKGLEKNDRAPNFNIFVPDGEDDRGGKGRGSGRDREDRGGGPATRVETRDSPDTEGPSNPLDDPAPKQEERRPSTRREAPPAPRSTSGRRSSSANGKRGYSRRSGRK